MLDCGHDKPLYARGMCQGCYKRRWRAGVFDGDPIRVKRAVVKCARCTLPSVPGKTLCRDCRDVLTRKEAALWVA